MQIAVLVLFALALWHNGQLRRQLGSIRRGNCEQFAAEDTFPPLAVVDGIGREVTLDLVGRRQLLLIAEPGCPACEAHVKRIPEAGTILSVASEAATKASLLADATVRVYALAKPARDVRLRRVPQILLVDSGRIVRTCANARDCR